MFTSRHVWGEGVIELDCNTTFHQQLPLVHLMPSVLAFPDLRSHKYLLSVSQGPGSAQMLGYDSKVGIVWWSWNSSLHWSDHCDDWLKTLKQQTGAHSALVLLMGTMRALSLIFLLQPKPQTTSQSSQGLSANSATWHNFFCLFFRLKSPFWESSLVVDVWEAVEKNNPSHFCITPFNPILQSPCPRILTIILKIGYYYPHFTAEEAKAQRSKMIFSKVLYGLLSYCLSSPVLLYSAKLGLRGWKPHFHLANWFAIGLCQWGRGG